VPIDTEPDTPDIELPEPTYSAPLTLPELDVPVLSTKRPLTPPAPALAVRRRSTPLLVVVLYPLVTLT
jgi:hypothetical protein